ncbi:hypothetical protein DFP72DRAFT_1063782 [Ephemerocybe angulata]|uniref:Methyltransferase domain-containing protein n=1 Tax=Ephemerocybe angulata TaxID=980116 RepID=A0A8H6MCV2_9AGAR|nr:hypothetical protein DFP72DRAFT_1063782 [Tulosesus angulatus]
MSSRTAAARKRIRQEPTKEPKEQKEGGLKGFFSRSKSAAPSRREEVPPTAIPTNYPSPPSSARAELQPQRDPYNGYPPQSPEIRVSRSETPRSVHPLGGYSPATPSRYSSSQKVADVYPSPQDQYRALPSKQGYEYDPPLSQGYDYPQVKKAASTSNMLSSFNNDKPLADQFPAPPSHVFIEASYQPPPPPRSRNGRPLPNNPTTGRPMNPSPYPPEKVPSPVTPHPPHIPSPSRTPPAPFPITSSQLSELNTSSPNTHPRSLQTSLLLQTAPLRHTSPSPVELPQYGYHSPPPPFRPNLQVTTNREGRYGEANFSHPMRREARNVYPSPPESDLAYMHDERPDLVTPTPREPMGNGGGWHDPRLVAPHEQEPISPGASDVGTSGQGNHPRYAASTTSRKSSASGSGSSQEKGSPVFVFPGSRSSVKPKISNSTGKVKVNITGKKSKSSIEKGREYNVGPASPVDGPTSPQPRSLTSLSRSQNSGQSSSGSSKDGPGTGSSMSHDEHPFTRARKMSTATTGTTNTSSGSSSAASIRSNPGFVYPGGRSRAQPKTTPLTMPSFKFTKKPKQSRNSSGSGPPSAGSRTRFMGISLKKKKSDIDTRPKTPPSPMFFTLAQSERSSAEYYDGASQLGSTTSGGGPAGPEFEAYRAKQMSPEFRRQERVKRIKSRIGAYPLDPYDTILLDNDRHTGDLLNRLNGTGCPSFYEYGSDPPATVLDLGCGQGHWVVDAAIAWKGHGTKVTGYDMVDISKVLLPWAVKQGVADNIRFVRGNFLKQRLPFNDNAFDLVRMSALTLCITADAWIFVFQEVCRVLTIGGRLELIDDSIIFPYGKPAVSSMSGLAAPSTPRLNMFAPRLDINIPTSAFSTFCIYDDADYSNPGLGFPEEDDEAEEDLLDLYQVKEEGESDLDETATLSGREPEARMDRASFQRDPRATPLPRNRSQATQTSSRLRSWNQHAATSRDLESLFEHMLTHKFGIHMSPEEFVLDLMKDVFGHAREMRTMHLSLAPPDVSLEDDGPRGRTDDSGSKSHDRYGSFGSNFRHIPSLSPSRTVRSQRMAGTPLSRSPGLVLSPSTFIPMTQQELEIHASKHLRMLLSAKKFLVEHAMEATEDEEIDEDSVLEALWEYEGFLRARFNHPPDYRGRDKSPSMSDGASTRGSIMSVSSDGQDAMWEYQSELRQRFAWPQDGSDSPTGSRSQITPKIASSTSGFPAAATPEPQPPVASASIPIPSSSARSSSPAPSVAPPYSRGEMAHVRTFRVYEAIKLDENMMASAA